VQFAGRVASSIAPRTAKRPLTTPTFGHPDVPVSVTMSTVAGVSVPADSTVTVPSTTTALFAQL
jgi:hypothetical protein